LNVVPGAPFRTSSEANFQFAILHFGLLPMFDDIKKTLRATSGKQRSNMDATEYASDLGRRSAAA